jgi:hypothetical protein
MVKGHGSGKRLMINLVRKSVVEIYENQGKILERVLEIFVQP